MTAAGRVLNKRIQGSYITCVAQWGSWLNAAEYYAKNLLLVLEIVNALEGTEQLLVETKEAVGTKSLLRSLRKIYQCCGSSL